MKMPKTKTKKGYYCALCKDIVAKYEMDINCCILEDNYICDKCAKRIAFYVVEEF